MHPQFFSKCTQKCPILFIYFSVLGQAKMIHIIKYHMPAGGH